MEENETPQTPESSENLSPPEQTPAAEQPQAEVKRDVPKEARTMAMLCHLLAIFTTFLGPLIIWLIKKDDDPFINEQGKEALNFQITVVIAMAASGILSFACIGLFLMPVVGILNLVFCIIATIKTNAGESYRYPVALRLIK